MYKLSIGYFISSSIIGFIFLYSFLTSLPDNKLHITFCNVGQGDGIYIRFPDGRDMVVDGGPNERLLQCLGSHMPFWDRHISMVLLTHPQKDHMQGLISVLERYTVDFFIRSDIPSSTEGFEKIISLVTTKHIQQKFAAANETISVGKTRLSFVWPTVDQLADLKRVDDEENVLGAQTDAQLNKGAAVFWLTYGSFTALFPSDADSLVAGAYTGSNRPDTQVEVLKVPHHGSKTGMDASFVGWLKPKLAVISVGKNTYGHPSKEAVQLLVDAGASIMRTDEHGDIEVVSDGKRWFVNP